MRYAMGGRGMEGEQANRTFLGDDNHLEGYKSQLPIYFPICFLYPNFSILTAFLSYLECDLRGAAWLVGRE